ncbi:MAG: ribbon-helix-helix protein, CopG family [Nevskia sp.]|nr:ribbon-helix-helix protein, CopG family [Nevskia sp.]
MAIMSVRSTYALDRETAARIKQLAKEWNASQAEVIRRAVRQAAERQAAGQHMTPAQALEHWRNNPPPRSEAETRRIVARMRADRHADDIRRSSKLDQLRRQT